jgi:hypothetical protein
LEFVDLSQQVVALKVVFVCHCVITYRLSILHCTRGRTS